jgi:hypothetical protein
MSLEVIRNGHGGSQGGMLLCPCGTDQLVSQGVIRVGLAKLRGMESLYV